MSRRFTIVDSPIAGVKLVRRKRLGDARGFLERMFCSDELSAVGWVKPVAQINRTLTAQVGVVRGMHFQHAPMAEMKLVSCVQGAVFDVVVDLRRGSPTFLRWFGHTLSADDDASMLVPEGCAHGLQTLKPDAALLYLHSAPYDAATEGAISVLEPRVGIAWPLPISEMSARDAAHPRLDDSFLGIDV
jgi:dTDP-4-dehydrorhamnose 3,5-epimerase